MAVRPSKREIDASFSISIVNPLPPIVISFQRRPAVSKRLAAYGCASR